MSASGIAFNKNPKISSGRTEGCIDWYLITTYYYSDGSRMTTEDYLFTTCDCDQQTTRVGRIDCDGGGGGGGATAGSGPVFPSADPKAGDLYWYEAPDGKATRYVYVASGNSGYWMTTLVVLPEFTVQNHPNDYSAFVSDSPPLDGTIVIGPSDGLLYAYDGGSASWEGEVPGDRPLLEYSNKCQGLQDIWNNYPNNEVYGYITSDGKLIVTNQLSYDGGQASGTYTYNGVTYYPYPVSQGAPSLNYAGMVTSAGYYLIPVVASVHTHSPCRTDGTDGVSQPVGNSDKTFAATHPELAHWVIGCNAIAQYDGNTSSFYNVQSGNISTTCNSIH